MRKFVKGLKDYRWFVRVVCIAFASFIFIGCQADGEQAIRDKYQTDWDYGSAARRHDRNTKNGKITSVMGKTPAPRPKTDKSASKTIQYDTQPAKPTPKKQGKIVQKTPTPTAKSAVSILYAGPESPGRTENPPNVEPLKENFPKKQEKQEKVEKENPPADTKTIAKPAIIKIQKNPTSPPSKEKVKPIIKPIPVVVVTEKKAPIYIPAPQPKNPADDKKPTPVKVIPKITPTPTPKPIPIKIAPQPIKVIPLPDDAKPSAKTISQAPRPIV